MSLEVSGSVTGVIVCVGVDWGVGLIEGVTDGCIVCNCVGVGVGVRDCGLTEGDGSRVGATLGVGVSTGGGLDSDGVGLLDAEGVGLVVGHLVVPTSFLFPQLAWADTSGVRRMRETIIGTNSAATLRSSFKGLLI